MAVALAGAHTFRNRQSSLPAVPEVVVHSLPKAVAGNVVVHGVGGCGGFQRRFPTGGAAYGIPSHSLTLLTDVLVIPHTGPEVVCTVVPGAHVPGCALADLAAGPAEAIATTATVTAATATAEPSTRDRHRNSLRNLMISISLFNVFGARWLVREDAEIFFPQRSHGHLMRDGRSRREQSLAAAAPNCVLAVMAVC